MALVNENEWQSTFGKDKDRGGSSAARSNPYPLLPEVSRGKTAEELKDFVRLELHIPVLRCGLLIGRGGAKIKELKQMFDIFLKVPNQHDQEGTLTIIEGPSARVDACKEAIAQTVRGEFTEVSRITGGDAARRAGLDRDAERCADRSSRSVHAAQNLPGTQSLMCSTGLSAMHPAQTAPAHFQASCTNVASALDQMAMFAGVVHPVIGSMKQAHLQGEEGGNIYVANFPHPLDEFGLYHLFAPFGAISHVHLVRQQENPSMSCGIGFVSFFQSHIALHAASIMNGFLIGPGPPLEVGLHQAPPIPIEDAPQGPAATRIDLHIPIHRCGLLIGAGGQVFKELQQTYGVKLKVPAKHDKEGSLTYIEGPAEGVAACYEDIAAKVKGECVVVGGGEADPSAPSGDADPMASHAMGASPLGAIAGGLLSSAAAARHDPVLAAAAELSEGVQYGGDLVRVELGVPMERCGLLVGKQGVVFKELQKKYGIRLKVPNGSIAELNRCNAIRARGQNTATLTECAPTVVEGPSEGVDACILDIEKKARAECKVLSRVPIDHMQ